MVEFLCFPMLHVCLKGFEVAATHLWHSMIRQLENMLINLDPIFPKKKFGTGNTWNHRFWLIAVSKISWSLPYLLHQPPLTSKCLMASAKRRSTSSVNCPDWALSFDPCLGMGYTGMIRRWRVLHPTSLPLRLLSKGAKKKRRFWQNRSGNLFHLTMEKQWISDFFLAVR